MQTPNVVALDPTHGSGETLLSGAQMLALSMLPFEERPPAFAATIQAEHARLRTQPDPA